MLETMERFNALLEKGGVGLTFEDCCKELGVLPPVLNEYLIKELGMSGSEIVDYYINGVCIGDKNY